VPAAARQHSERAAAGGDISVKLCWGNTQEAAALYCIMNMFPHSLLEEVSSALGAGIVQLLSACSYLLSLFVEI